MISHPSSLTNLDFRLLAMLFNSTKATIIKHFWTVAEAHYKLDKSLPMRWNLDDDGVLLNLLTNLADRLQHHNKEVFETYLPLCQEGERLVVIALDGTHLNVNKSKDHYTQKSTYNVYKSRNTVVKLEGRVLMPIYFSLCVCVFFFF